MSRNPNWKLVHTVYVVRMNVGPEILETVLKACPAGVANAIIVLVSDPVLYQVMCACIRRGRNSSVIEETLTEFCKTVHNDKPGLLTVLTKFYYVLEAVSWNFEGKKTSRKELERIANKTFVWNVTASSSSTIIMCYLPLKACLRLSYIVEQCTLTNRKTSYNNR